MPVAHQQPPVGSERVMQQTRCDAQPTAAGTHDACGLRIGDPHVVVADDPGRPAVEGIDVDPVEAAAAAGAFLRPGEADALAAAARFRQARTALQAEQVERLAKALPLPQLHLPFLFTTELGLTEVEVAFDDLQDPYGIEFWPEFKGRDGCRTPMVWDRSKAHGGFSDVKPWLPVDAAHLEKAVSVQDSDPDSLLNHYRRILAFRQSQPVLGQGEQSPARVDGTVLHFERTEGSTRVFCAFNLSDEAAEVALPKGDWQRLGDTIGTATIGDGSVTLTPWQAAIAVRD